MSYDIGSITTKTLHPENVGVAVGIVSLCALELEIWLGVILPLPSLPQKRPLPGQVLTVSRPYGAGRAVSTFTGV